MKSNILKLLLFVLFVSININMNAQKSRLRLANDYFEHFSFGKAIIAYESLKFKSPVAYRNLAKSYLMLDNTEKAEINYAELMTSGKYKPADVYGYASVLLMNEKYDEAVKWMQKYYELKPNDTRGYRFSKNPEYYKELLEKDTLIVLKNLSINSKFQDFSPAYYKNSKVAFASSRDDSFLVNRKWNGNNQPFLDLYTATIQDDNTLSDVKKFSKQVNQKYHDAPATFNKEGNIMIVTRNDYDKRDKKFGVIDNNLMLYESVLNDNNKWTRPVKLSFNDKRYSCGQACLSLDGNSMYFASDMPGGFGGTDIYYVERTSDGKWGKPQNLGHRINTEGNEMFPYFDQHNQYLFFSSNGLPGLGGLDVFVSKIRDNGTFTRPTNLGEPVNGKNDDFSLIYQKEGKGFLSSNRPGGKGDDDIYSYIKLEKFKERIYDFNLSGTITDKETKQPLDFARVVLYNERGKVIGDIETGEDGMYLYPIDYGDVYKIKVMHDGYIGKSVNVDSKFVGKSDIIKDFSLEKPKPIVKAKTKEEIEKEMCSLDIRPLYYRLNKSNLLENYKKELSRVIVVMKKFPRVILEVSSYTDSRGSKSYNKKLSKRRTKAVVDYFVSHGINRDRLVMKWFGEEKLVNGCSDGIKCTEDEHQLNRRTDFNVLNCNKPE